jgi:hypothetical protein
MVGSTQQPERVEIPDVQTAISRLDFPIAPQDLAALVAERNGDERVVAVLARLPERLYESPAEVLDAVRQLDPADRDAPRGGHATSVGAAAAPGSAPQGAGTEDVAGRPASLEDGSTGTP